MAFTPIVPPMAKTTFKPMVQPLPKTTTIETPTTPYKSTTSIMDMIGVPVIQGEFPKISNQINATGEFIKEIPGRLKTSAKTLWSATGGMIVREADAMNQLINSALGQPTITHGGSFGELYKDISGQPLTPGVGKFIPAPKGGGEKLQGIASSLAKMGASPIMAAIATAYAPSVIAIGAFTPEIQKTIENYQQTYNTMNPDTKTKIDAMATKFNDLMIKPMPASLKDMIPSLISFAIADWFAGGAMTPKQPTYSPEGEPIYKPAQNWRELANEPLMGTKEAPGMIPQVGTKLAQATVTTLKTPYAIAKWGVQKFQDLTGNIEDKLAKAVTEVDKEQASILIDKQIRKMGMSIRDMDKFYKLTNKNVGRWVIDNGYYDPNPQKMVANFEQHFKSQYDIKNAAIDAASLNPNVQGIKDPRALAALEENDRFLRANMSNSAYGQKAILDNQMLINKFNNEGLTLKDNVAIQRQLESVRSMNYSVAQQGSEATRIKDIDTGMRELNLETGVKAGIPQWADMNNSIQASKAMIRATWKAAYPELLKELQKEGLDIIDYIIIGGGHLTPASLSTAWLRHQIRRFQDYQLKYMVGEPTTGVIKPDFSNIGSKSVEGVNSYYQGGVNNIQDATAQALQELGVIGKGEQTDILTLLKNIEYDMNLQKTGVVAGQFRQLSFDDLPAVMQQAKEMQFPISPTQLNQAMKQMQMEHIALEAELNQAAVTQPIGHQYSMDEIPNPNSPTNPSQFNSPKGGGGGGNGGGGGSSAPKPPKPVAKPPSWTTQVSYVEAKPTQFNKFLKAFKEARPEYANQLTPYKISELKDMQLFVSDNGTSGFAIKSDGTLANVFSSEKGMGDKLVQQAIASGANKLDAFDGHLVELYGRNGFVETNRIPFNDEFSPKGWDYNRFGRPDVVEMALPSATPSSTGNVPQPAPKMDIVQGGGGTAGETTNKGLGSFYDDEKIVGLHGEGATAPALPQRLAGLKNGDYVMVGKEPAQVIGGTNTGLQVKFLSDDSVDIITNYDRVAKATTSDVSKYIK